MGDYIYTQRTNSRVLGCTCVILSPEKLIRELLHLSLRNFIVVRSLSVQMGSSISVSLADDAMRGKTYSAKEFSAATLDAVIYVGELKIM